MQDTASVDRRPPPPLPGAYVLVLRVDKDLCITTRARRITVQRGYYTYTGSAAGPGGLRARITRHLGARRRRLHWHIDYILEAGASIEAIVYTITPEGREIETCIARCLDEESEPLEGVGSTDDPHAKSHLHHHLGLASALEKAVKCMKRCVQR